jgi:hypothetical protein
MKTHFTFLLLVVAARAHTTPVTNINAFYRDGQVFVTWTNPTPPDNMQFTLYKSIAPILRGIDLLSAENLGNVRGYSCRRPRPLIWMNLKIDSAGTPLPDSIGLFVGSPLQTMNRLFLL